MSPTPSRAPQGVDLDAVATWMSGQGLGAGPLEDVSAATGGTQNVMLRFTRAGRAYVLRRGPRHLRSRSNTVILRETKVPAALAGSDVPHPHLIATCDDTGVLGDAAFYLMEPVDGFNAGEGLPPLHASDAAVRYRMGLSTADALDARDHARRLPRRQRDVLPHRTRGGRHRRLGDVHDRRPAAGPAGHLAPARRDQRAQPRPGRPRGAGQHRRAVRPVSRQHDPRPVACHLVHRAGLLQARHRGVEGTLARACVGKAEKQVGDQLHAATVHLFERALTLLDSES